MTSNSGVFRISLQSASYPGIFPRACACSASEVSMLMKVKSEGK